jgi:acyl transferase domain-containing protein/acyl carrier protein
MERNQPDYASLMRQALLKLKQAEAQIRALTEARREPIAVIGMAGRFPGAANVNDLPCLLEQGVDAITEIPRDRWNKECWFDDRPEDSGAIHVRHGGFVEDVDCFDAPFFGISASEAAAMDPQQRMVLETSWHALEDAGLTRARLAHATTAVYLGITSNDYGALIQDGPLDAIAPTAGSGNALSVAAGRVAYFLDLHGPAISVDTACSSSLVAIHLAIQSLRTRECRAALAGGVNLLLNPRLTLNFARAGMLSPDGRCKAFDDRANGYVRAEGCGMLVLKRLADAIADGDRVHALLRGSAINSDGRSSGLTVPSGDAQQSVIRAALRDASLHPNQVQYVEAHGTGTSLGDPIELGALQAVYGAAQGRAEPILVASLKSNLGHLEGAAGVSGVIKTILAMKRKTLPRSLHFRELNHHAHAPGVRVLDCNRPWPEVNDSLHAGVSSFGFSGTNAHAIVESAPAQPEEQRRLPRRASWLLALSARDPATLLPLAGAYASTMALDDLAGATRLCAAAYRRREHFPYRLAVAASSPAELRDRLQRFSESGEAAEGVFTGRARSPELRVFFAGVPCRDASAGSLEELEPAFAQAMKDHATEDPQRGSRIALLELFLSWGLRPASAVCDGDIEDAAKILHAAGLALPLRLAEPCSRSNPEHSDRRHVLDIHSIAANLSAPDAQYRLMKVLAELFTAGVEFNGDALDQGCNAWEELPLYPFAKQRYWVSHRWRGDDLLARNDLYDLRWEREESSLAATVEDLERAALAAANTNAAVEQGGRTLLDALERRAAALAREALRQAPTPIAKYHLLLRRLEEVASAPELDGPCGDCVADAIKMTPEWRLLERCGRAAEAVLSGRRNAVSLLLPDGDATDLKEIYSDSAAAVEVNRMLQAIVRRALSGAQPVRVLEAGAGTGGATAGLLPLLTGREVEYLFTDVSPAFLDAAQQQFSVYDFVRFAAFDLEREPEPQGLVHASFDLIVAANVVHATSDIVAALNRLRRLLRPGGLLILQEGVERLAWVDLTFGLTEGWWAFRDGDLRKDHPLLSGERWREALVASGFEQASLAPARLPGGQALLIAKAPVYPPAERSRDESVHLVLADSSGAELAISRDARSGQRFVVARCKAGSHLHQHAKDEWILDPTDPEQVRTLTAAYPEIDSAMHLLALDAEAGVEEASSRQRWIGGSALALAQALARRRCRLFLFTRNSQHVAPGDQAAGFAQAPIWGLAKTLALEHPQLSLRLVDLDETSDPSVLSTEHMTGGNEQLIAWRAGRRYRARLKARDLPKPARPPVVRDGCYVVTGGLGGLGRTVAEWLVRAGAGEILLLGRREPDAATQQKIVEWNRRGSKVRALQIDVSSRSELERALAGSHYPVRGALHAAGVLKDGRIDRLAWSDFETVMAPKIGGLCALHLATEHLALDWFVVFSSAIGLLGNPGQANHAAASAFGPAFMEYRRARGLAGLCIDWGAWSRTGAAADLRASGSEILPGVSGIDPDRALALLEGLLAEHATRAAVIEIDWEEYRLALGVELPPHLRQLQRSQASAGVHATGNHPPEGSAPGASSKHDLADAFPYLCEQVSAMLGHPRQDLETDIGISQLGFDSLMAVRLRNRVKSDLGVDIPVAGLLENRSIRELAELVQQQEVWMEGAV